MHTVCLKVREDSYEKLIRIISAFEDKEIEIEDVMRYEQVVSSGFEEALKLHAKFIEIGEMERRLQNIMMRGDF